MRNVDTLECRPASIFDCGSSLWFNVDDYELKHRNFTTKSKQFYENPSKQLLLVDDFSILEEEKLKGFVEDAIAILSQNLMLQARIDMYEKLLSEKVNRLLEIAAFG